MTDKRYAALFSGGKDSYLALTMAMASGHTVDRLVTVDAPVGSHVYHAPATQATAAIADAIDIDIDLLELPPDFADSSADSQSAATRELEPLETYLDRPAADDLDGLVSGVVASRYQYDRLSSRCAERGLDLVTPLWGHSGDAVLEAVLDAGIAVDIVAVAADGLDRSWLGRRLDAPTVRKLRRLASSVGLHSAGEGGEYETLVVDGPAFSAPIEYEATPIWDGTRGHLRLDTVGVAVPPTE